MREPIMSVHGNRKPPYHAHGRRQCEAAILVNCHKLMAIVSEAPVSYDRALYLHALDRIDDARRTLERLGPRIHGEEPVRLNREESHAKSLSGNVG
ncbi:MAG: hypothetical protein ABIH03_00520 [Pseudomonadota bacterium]